MDADDIDLPRVQMTHYAWLGICPLYAARTGPDELVFCTRSDWFEPLWLLSLAVIRLSLLPLYLIGHPTRLPILLTGRIDGN